MGLELEPAVAQAMGKQEGQPLQGSRLLTALAPLAPLFTDEHEVASCLRCRDITTAALFIAASGNRH